MAERFESVLVGTTERDWMPQPHALPATTASSEPPSCSQQVGHSESYFSCGALDHFKKCCPKNLKTKGTKPSTQEKLQQCVRILKGLGRHPVKEPTTFVLRTEFVTVQCVTSWLAN